METSGLSPDDPLNYHYDLHHQNLARVLVAQGILAGSSSSLELAQDLLARLGIAAEKAGWVHEQIKALVLRAVACEARNNGEAALQDMAQAVGMAEPGGYVQVFIDEGETARDLMANLAELINSGRPADLKRLGIHFEGEQLARLYRYTTGLLSAFDHPIDQVKQSIAAPLTSAQAGVQTGGRPDLSTLLVEPLTEREVEVLILVARGYSDKKIAEALFIARETVHKHLKNIYGKLGVHSRTVAIASARQLGFL